MRDLGHRRAAARGEEPRGPCTYACAWRACTLADRLKNFVRRKRAGARSPSQRLSPKWHRARGEL